MKKRKCWHRWKRVLPFSTCEWVWACEKCDRRQRFAMIDARNMRGKKP